MVNVVTIEMLYFWKIIMKDDSMEVVLKDSPFHNSKEEAEYFEKWIQESSLQ